MQAEILTKISEVVDANLPQAMGEAFKKLFNEAETNKKLVESQKNQIEALQYEKKVLNDEKSALLKLELKFNDLENRESKIAQREKNADMFELKLKVVETEKKMDMMHNLVTQLTKNTTFRETIFENDNMQSDYYNGQTIRTKVGSTKTTTQIIE